MPIGSSLGITLPTQGSNSGTWGSDLNTELNKIITAVEAQVPASAIDFSADFDLNNYSITSLKGVQFGQQSSYTGLNSLYYKTDGNLYGRDGSNNEIQFTASGALNNASAGGLGDSGGTYGTSGITFDWDGTRYNAKDGSGANDYANVRMDELQLRDGSGNDLTIAVPAMSSNYTLTLPAAVPASTGLFLQANTSGTASWSNSTAQDITLTGTADLKHPDHIMLIPACAAYTSSTGIDSDGTEIVCTGAGAINFPVTIRSGATINRMKVYWKHSTVTAAVVTWDLMETDGSGGATSVLAGTDLNGTGGTYSFDEDTGSALTAAGKGYWVQLNNNSGTLSISHVEITYTRS